MSIADFIKRHPITTYYALTFTISLGGGFIVMAPGGIPAPSAQEPKLFPIVLLVLMLGPSVAGPLLTHIFYGRAGLREFLSRLGRFRVGARWYAVALLTIPLLATAVLSVLSLTSSVFLPALVTSSHKGSLLLSGVAVGLVGGFLEELGWTGFAVPGLRRHYGVLTTGLIMGFLWGAWHMPSFYWGSGNASGALSLDLFLPPFLFGAGALPPYRVLMVWVYDHTRSISVVVLMHASLIFTTLYALVPATSDAVVLMTNWLVLIVALWVIVAAVFVTKGLRGGDLE